MTMLPGRPSTTNYVRLVIGATLAACLACGSDVSSPSGGDSNTDGTSAKPTHPEGTLGTKISLDAPLTGVAIDSSGIAYVTEIDGTVARFRISAPSPALTPIVTGNLAQDVVLNRAGTTAYVGSSGKVSIVDVASGTVKSAVLFPSDVRRLALSPDEARLYVVGSSNVYMMPTAGGAVVTTPLNASLFGIATSPTGNAVYVAALSGGSVWKLDPATLAVQTKVTPTGPFLGDLAVSLDGKEVYAVQDGGALYILDGTTLATLGGVDLKSAPTAMAVTPDGTQLYITSNSSGTLQVVDRVTRAVLKTIDLGGFPNRITFDRLGKVALVTNENGWVDVIR